MAESETMNFFTDNYYRNMGELCDIPDTGGLDWYTWMIEEGKKMNEDLSQILPEGDLREKLRRYNPYLFKVYLQSQVELMTEGKRSVRIMTEESRIKENEEYNKKMDELIIIFNGTLNRFFEGKKNKKLVHGNGKKPEEAYCELSIADLELLYNKSKESENDRDLMSSISSNCIRILIRESRTKKPVKKTIEEDFNEIEINLIEQHFYSALSEFIEKRLTRGFRKWAEQRVDETEDEVEEKFSELNEDRGKRERSFKRVSRILSLIIISLLYVDDLIIRKAGSYDDYLLHKSIDNEKSNSNKKQIGQYKNMVSFSPKLKSIIGTFEDGEHPIFRVLRSHTHRYMYCCPEDHSQKNNQSGDFSPSLGGYINPNSSVGFTVSNEKKLSKIIGRTRFEYTDKTLESLNILQKTQWEVNIDFLTFITEGIEGNEIDLNKDFEMKKTFINSFYYPTDRNICRGSDCKELISDIDSCVDCWRLRNNNHLENIERKKRFIWITRILNHNANVFWHSWAFDWRGRLIARAPVLSPQKSDIDRSLIRFKEWKKLGDSGWYWFRIFLFNLLAGIPQKNLFTQTPKKDFSNEEKILWIDSNEDNLILLVKNLHDDKSIQKYLQLNDPPKPKSETFQRISALLEYKRLIEKSKIKNTDVKNIKSGHPVHFDASSNGYQHLSMLTNNLKLAVQVNVFSNKTGNESIKNDLYQEVSENAKSNWEKDDSELKKYLSDLIQLDIEQIEEIRDKVFSRNMSKLPTMTHIYGARDSTYEQNFIGKNGKGKPDYIRNKNLDELPKYFVCWHYESPIYEALKEFDENNNCILLDPDGGIFSRKSFATEEEKRIYSNSNSTLKQSIFIHCLIQDYKKSINEVTGNSYTQLKESLHLAIKEMDGFEVTMDELRKTKKPIKLTPDDLKTLRVGDQNKNSTAISWKLDDDSKVENFYPTKKITTQLDTGSTLGILNTPIFTELSSSKFSLLNYFNDNISNDFPKYKFNDEFIIEALIEHSSNKYNDDKLLLEDLNKKLYDNNFKHLPWKIYSYRLDLINDLEAIDFRLKEIDNAGKGSLCNAINRKNRAEKSDKKNKKNKIKQERETIKQLRKEKKKLEKEKSRLISIINKRPNQIENEKLLQQKKEENHNYWVSISSFIKLKRIEKPTGFQNPIGFLRAIMEYLFNKLNSEKLDNESNRLLEDWQRACNLTITCNFIDYSEEIDLTKSKSSIAPNFIHSLDAYHMRSSIVKFRQEFENDYVPSIWAVHDSFGTHACYIEKYMQIIKESFLEMHQEKDLLDWCVEICDSANLDVTEDVKKFEEEKERKPNKKDLAKIKAQARRDKFKKSGVSIENSDFRKNFKDADIKTLLNESTGQIPKMSDFFLS